MITTPFLLGVLVFLLIAIFFLYKPSENLVTEKKGTCSACVYWKRYYDKNYGECKKNAPTFSHSNSAYFPTTREEDYCHQYEMKEGAKDYFCTTAKGLEELKRD